MAVSQKVKKAVLEVMEDHLKSSKEAHWKYRPDEQYCPDKDNHNRSSQRLAAACKARYLDTSLRRIERYRKTGVISSA